MVNSPGEITESNPSIESRCISMICVRYQYAKGRSLGEYNSSWNPLRTTSRRIEKRQRRIMEGSWRRIDVGGRVWCFISKRVKESKGKDIQKDHIRLISVSSDHK